MANTTIIYEALKAHFEAQRKKSVATLSVYFNNAAGIGEHPQIIDEMVEQTKLLAEPNDCLDTLLNTFEDQMLYFVLHIEQVDFVFFLLVLGKIF